MRTEKMTPKYARKALFFLRNMKNVFTLLVLLFSTSTVWAKTGFYSDTFDHPTFAEIESIKDALRQLKLDRLIVMVDRIPTNHEIYRSSAFERAKTLTAELEDVKDSIHILIEPWSGKELYLQTLRSQDEIQVIEKKNSSTSKQELYTAISEPLTIVKKLLHEEAFQTFKRAMALLFPDENLLTTSTPPFVPRMSNLGRVDQFIYSVIRENHFISDKADTFGKKAEKILISTIRNEPYAKLHCLNEVSVSCSVRPQVTLSFLTLPQLPTDQKHTFNVENYCSDRFPKALFASRLFQENGTYFHLGSTEEALAYHQSEEFTEIYELRSQAVRKLRNYHLVKNPATSEIRFVVSNLHGKDTLQHVALQFNTIAKFKKIHLVQHANPSLLFNTAARFQNMVFQPRDTLIIGFKNAISRLLLKNQEWTQATFSDSGLHIDLYENRRTQERILLSKCVYGDQLLELLDFFHKRGIRRYHYFGTSGSLSPHLHIGDAIIPLAFSNPTQQNSHLFFHNKAATLLKKINNERIKLVGLHGWVQSPVQETELFLKNLQSQGNQSIDVEARYYGEFFHNHPEASTSMVLFISDEPFGNISLEHFNTMDYYVDEAFTSVIHHVLPQLYNKEQE